MIKKSITYTDYDGIERTEDYYFNLSKAELIEMDLSQPGGFEQMVKKVIDTKDTPSLLEIFKKIIMMSYGEKSPDGKRFVKNKELTEAFTQTEAYSELFMELITNEEAAANFINGIVPQQLMDQAKQQGLIK